MRRSNGNRTEWCTIQGVIAKREADMKLRARLPLNCTSYYQLIVSIRKCMKLCQGTFTARTTFLSPQLTI